MSQSTLLVNMRYDLDQKNVRDKLEQEQRDNTLVEYFFIIYLSKLKGISLHKHKNNKN